MNQGNRKLKAFYATQICIVAVIVIALFKGVVFSGNDITVMVMTIGGVSAMFFGGNAAEWLAQRPTAKPLPNLPLENGKALS